MQQNTIKVGMVSLGCPKNQCDAELMLFKIADSGFHLVEEVGLADVVILNTCGFIRSAKEEAIEEILEAVSRKNDGINKKIIITGCLAQRYKEQVREEFPEVDAIIGIGRNQDIVEVINSVLLGKKMVSFPDFSCHEMNGERMLSTLPHYAYLRIADGCDNCCSYCAIPQIRGSFRSRETDIIIEEAQVLADKGVKEIILVAQDVTRYGLDLYGKLTLPELLKKLCNIEGIKWIRLFYCYPELITDELVEVMKTESKIVKYIDLPIQHCNKEILREMNRSGDEQTLLDTIAKLRSLQGMIIRTTIITGFPGETEEQFTQLAEFVNKVGFERLGCFAYSEEEGTPAADFDYQIDESERAHRAEVIMEQQESRLAEIYAGLVGETMEVVVEGYDRYFEMYFGRSYMYGPEIDGMIYFKGKDLSLSDFVNVEITEVIDNNLIGQALK